MVSKNWLTHLAIVPHICVGKLGQHCLRSWLNACVAPSHYLNQSWLVVNWTLRSKLQRNSNGHTKRFIHDNAFQKCRSENGCHFIQREIMNIGLLSWWRYLKQSKQWLHEYKCKIKQRLSVFHSPHITFTYYSQSARQYSIKIDQSWYTGHENNPFGLQHIHNFIPLQFLL